MKIALGGDHAGYPLKQVVHAFLIEQGHEVVDCGSYDPEPVDFPDIAAKLCGAIVQQTVDRGIMVCGTGVGQALPPTKRRAFGQLSATIFTQPINVLNMMTST